MPVVVWRCMLQADASLAVVSALAVPVRQWTALGLWAQSLQAYSDCPLVRRYCGGFSASAWPAAGSLLLLLSIVVDASVSTWLMLKHCRALRLRSTTATMLRKLRDAKTKETQEAEALWRRTAGLFVFKRIRYGNRCGCHSATLLCRALLTVIVGPGFCSASSPDTGSSFGRRIFKWAFFVEAVDGSPLDFISSVTIDLHPSFQTVRPVPSQ